MQQTIQELRTLRAEMKLDKKKVAAEFASADAGVREVVAANRDGIVRLGLLTELSVTDGKLAEGGGGKRSTAQFDLRIPYVAETIDVGAELARIKKEIERLRKDIAGKEGQLGNETFRSRAPEKIIQGLEAHWRNDEWNWGSLRSGLGSWVGREIMDKGEVTEKEREKKRINAEDTERRRGHRERKKERKKEGRKEQKESTPRKAKEERKKRYLTLRKARVGHPRVKEKTDASARSKGELD